MDFIFSFDRMDLFEYQNDSTKKRGLKWFLSSHMNRDSDQQIFLVVNTQRHRKMEKKSHFPDKAAKLCKVSKDTYNFGGQLLSWNLLNEKLTEGVATNPYAFIIDDLTLAAHD